MKICVTVAVQWHNLDSGAEGISDSSKHLRNRMHAISLLSMTKMFTMITMLPNVTQF